MRTNSVASAYVTPASVTFYGLIVQTNVAASVVVNLHYAYGMFKVSSAAAGLMDYAQQFTVN
jgi:hypothetical protein